MVRVQRLSTAFFDLPEAAKRRVAHPPAKQATDSQRLSPVFFHNLNYDAPLAELPGTVLAGGAQSYRPTTSGEYLSWRFACTRMPPAAAS